MEKETCVACNSNKIKRLRFLQRYENFLLSKCNACGLKFLTTGDFEKFDDNQYWDDVNKKIYIMPEVLNEIKKNKINI